MNNSEAERPGGRPPADTKPRPSRALVLVPELKHASRDAGFERSKLSETHAAQSRLQEAVGLAEAISLDVVEARIVPLQSVRPATLLGSGKVDELAEWIAEQKIDVAIVDAMLSPVQQRNLENAWKTKVIDRTGLILEIFGARARTREGVLQVELAHLEYQKGRLFRAWTHLERQRGGGGFVGGPGEAQIELDRRMLQTRINAIKRELADVVKTRELHRAGRRKVPYPIVAIVGYTNAGKSTLFNRITGASVMAADQVFATLDPTMRELKLESGRRIILSDTVGFISDLPTMLVAAFRATLEEVVEADLILHVRDIAHHETDAQARDVEKVLQDLGIETNAADSSVLEVWNKVDLLDDGARQELMHEVRRRERPPVLVSAVSGFGLEELAGQIDEQLGQGDEIFELDISGTEGALINWLYETGRVLRRDDRDDGRIDLQLSVPSEKKARVIARLRDAGVVV